MGAVTSREGEVWMPWSQLGFEPNGQRCVLNALVKLKEMWMAFSDAVPDYFYRSFRRKGSNSLNRQKDCAKVNCLEFSPQGKIDILRHVEAKTEDDMDLLTALPTDTADLQIEAN